jgi:hypothetical protein
MKLVITWVSSSLCKWRKRWRIKSRERENIFKYLILHFHLNSPIFRYLPMPLVNVRERESINVRAISACFVKKQNGHWENNDEARGGV